MSRLPGLLICLFSFSFVLSMINMINEASVPKNTDVFTLPSSQQSDTGDGSEYDPYTIESLPNGDYHVSAVSNGDKSIILRVYSRWVTLTSTEDGHKSFFLTLQKTGDVTPAMEASILKAYLVKDHQGLKVMLPRQ